MTVAPVVSVHGTTMEGWLCIVCVAVLAITGEVLTAGAMRRIGDLDVIRERSGLLGAVRAVLESPMFVAGSLAMAVNFFALLYTLSVVEVSLAAPATASLTYIGNAIAAKLFLHEDVNRRRWLGTAFLVIGVVLLAH
jgi:multidrug transporter EmrE-like cation transporter